jgi:hypothetical protein
MSSSQDKSVSEDQSKLRKPSPPGQASIHLGEGTSLLQLSRALVPLGRLHAEPTHLLSGDEAPAGDLVSPAATDGESGVAGPGPSPGAPAQVVRSRA